jgi:monodehydroascorbate reductase (NADH)
LLNGYSKHDAELKCLMMCQVTAVILKDGSRIDADIVVIGIGIRPNVDLFEGQLTLEKGGIKVNGKMQSVSNSSIYAVGDVAAFPVPMYNDVRRLEHVDHARKSAAHAVQAILTGNKVSDYDYLPYFYSRVFTLSWQFYGDNVGQCVLFGDRDAGKFGAYWVHNGRLVGAFLEGGSKVEYAALAKTARERPHVKDISLLKKQGLDFAMSVAEPIPQMSLMSSITSAESNMLLSHPSKWVLQAGGGVVLGLAVVGVIYWFGSRRSRRKL